MRSRRFFERLFENWPAKIISLGVALVLFLFYRIVNLDDRYFNVPLQVEVSRTFTAAGDFPRRVRITMRGKEAEISQILEEDILAQADLSSITEEGVYQVPVEITKSGSALGLESLEIMVDPIEVTIALERKLRKSLEVTPYLAGFPAKGYELSQYFITPSTVEVEGPENVIEGMDTVETAEIDLSDKMDNFTVRVPLEIDESISLVSGENVVEFHGIIQERVILKTFNRVPIITLDLQPNLKVVDPAETGFIQVQGTQNFLENIDPGQLSLLVDCSQITVPGTYTLDVRPEVIIGVLVLNYGPQNVNYVIENMKRNEE